jgi:hypothetical protein
MANYGSWISGSSAYAQMSRQRSVTSATLTRDSGGHYQLRVTTDQGAVVANQALGTVSPGEAQDVGAVYHDAFNQGIAEARSEYAARASQRAARDKTYAERHAERRGRGRSGAYEAAADPWGGE